MQLSDSVSVETVTNDKGLHEIHVTGKLSRGTDSLIKATLAESSGDHWQSEGVVLNLSDVGFLDSAGISALLTLQHELNATGGKLVLCHVPPRINQMFDVVGMARVIPVVDTLDQAQEVCEA